MASSNSQTFSEFSAEDMRDSDSSVLEQIDLQHYLRILRKHKWPIILFTALITALAGYYAYTTTPVYRSTSTLLIESQGTNNLVQFEELVGMDTGNQDYYETQFELLKSRGLALRVVNHMNLWTHPEFSSQPQVSISSADVEPNASDVGGLQGLVDKVSTLLGNVTGATSDTDAPVGDVVIDLSNPEATNIQVLSNQGSESALAGSLISSTEFELSADMISASTQNPSLEQQSVVNTFMGRLSVTPVRKTKLVNIGFESTDPEFAALVANTVAEQYIESYLDAKLEMTTKASTWLNERLGDLKGILEDSEDRLIAYKEANGLVDVGGSVGRLNEQELLLATTELAQARSDLSSQSDLYREVQNLRGNTSLLESIPAIQADPLIQRVKIEQGQAQRSLDELRNRYGERHPRVVDAMSQLDTLNSTLQSQLVRVAENISKDYQLTRQRVASIESKLAAGKREIQALGTKKFELDELEREVETNRSIYNTFFSRITEASSADGLETANARISDAAVPALSPFKPKKQLIIALAAIASLVLSMLMALLYEQMDDTIRSTNDIEDKLGLKFLGILPLIKGGMFSKERTLPLNPLEISDAKGRFAEAVNTIRTTLSLDDGKALRKVTAVTSSVPSEGKSSTSINLAFSFAQFERVLLVDCDLRKPTVAKAAGFEKNIPGLSNLITKTAPASKCIQRGAFGGALDILPSGPITEQPLELLSSKRFEKILAQLSEHYDRVVIDCPPVQAVSDALAIGRLTDAMVYCVKSHDTSIELVKRGVRRLHQAGAPVAGVIITQVDIDKITAYGGDYYYQGYYDYYGYTEKGQSSKNKGAGGLRLTKDELHAMRSDDDDMEIDLDYMADVKTNGRGAAASHVESYDDFNETERFDFHKTEVGSSNVSNVLQNRPDDVLRARRNNQRLRDDLDIL